MTDRFDTCDMCGKKLPVISGKIGELGIFHTHIGKFCTYWGAADKEGGKDAGCWPKAWAMDRARVEEKKKHLAKCLICGKEGTFGDFLGFSDYGECHPTCEDHLERNAKLFDETYSFGDELLLRRISGPGKGFLRYDRLRVMFRGLFGYIVEHPERPIVFTSTGFSSWSVQFNPVKIDEWEVGDTSWKVSRTGKKHKSFVEREMTK